MTPFHNTISPRQDAPPQDAPVPKVTLSWKTLEKWLAGGSVLVLFVAILGAAVIALANSNRKKDKEIRRLNGGLGRQNDEEDVTGDGGIVLRQYEARSLPALKAKLETTERENVDLKQRLNTATQTLDQLKKESATIKCQLRAANDRRRESLGFNSVQDPSSWIGQAVTSPPSTPHTSPIDIPTRRSDKGKEKKVYPAMSIRRKSVPGKFVRNGDARAATVEIHGKHESIASSMTGSIGMIEDSFDEPTTPFNLKSPTMRALRAEREQRDPLHFISEDPNTKFGCRSPVSELPLPPLPRKTTSASAKNNNPGPSGPSTAGDANYRQSYHGSRSRRESPLTSPGAKSLPAGSPQHVGFDDISLDD